MQGKMSDYSFRRHFSDVSALQTQTSDTQREEFACMGASKTFVAPSDSVSVCVCVCVCVCVWVGSLEKHKPQ